MQPRTEIPEYRTREEGAAVPFRFIPTAAGRWLLDTMEPGPLWFFDNFELDVKARGGKNKLLMGYDVITGGMRIKPFKHKFEIGEMADEIFIEEGLNRRKVRVVVGADGDGAMALLKTAARKRGIAFLPIPPYSPHLSPVEGAIGLFKMMVGAVLLSACTETGALTTEHAAFAAAYVCYVYERFCKERSFDTYRGRYTEMKSPWELNTLTKARFGRIVPFGAAGYAYVSKSLRNARARQRTYVLSRCSL